MEYKRTKQIVIAIVGLGLILAIQHYIPRGSGEADSGDLIDESKARKGDLHVLGDVWNAAGTSSELNGETAGVSTIEVDGGNGTDFCRFLDISALKALTVSSAEINRPDELLSFLKEGVAYQLKMVKIFKDNEVEVVLAHGGYSGTHDDPANRVVYTYAFGGRRNESNEYVRGGFADVQEFEKEPWRRIRSLSFHDDGTMHKYSNTVGKFKVLIFHPNGQLELYGRELEDGSEYAVNWDEEGKITRQSPRTGGL